MVVAHFAAHFAAMGPVQVAVPVPVPVQVDAAVPSRRVGAGRKRAGIPSGGKEESIKQLITNAGQGDLDAAVRKAAALSPLQLMEAASLRLWDAIEPFLPAHDAPLVAVCGRGDNGGDAMAILRHAHFAGRRNLAAVVAGGAGDAAKPAAEPEVAAETAEPAGAGPQAAKSAGADPQAASLEALGIPILRWPDDRDACIKAIAAASVVLDGILGSGSRGGARGIPAEMIGRIGEPAAAGKARPLVFAVDLPSGLRDGQEPGDAVLRADRTFALEPLKASLFSPMGRMYCGSIVPVARVFPSAADHGVPGGSSFLLEDIDLDRLAVETPDDAWKGARGKLAVFAGSVGAVGAARLCARSALSSGAGYVALFVPDEIAAAAASGADEVMVRPTSAAPFRKESWNAFLAGPGWGTFPDRAAMLEVLLDSGLPGVLDADAIRLYARIPSGRRRPASRYILTPHAGEFEALTGVPAARSASDPAAHLAAACLETGAVIALKSHVTWIGAPDGRLAVWDGMEPGLGTAGSGDVLAGVAGGLLARGMDAFDAACLAVAAHGRAGKLLRKRSGWFTAGDLPAEIAGLLGKPRR